MTAHLTKDPTNSGPAQQATAFTMTLQEAIAGARPVREVAARAGVSERTVERWIAKGALLYDALNPRTRRLLVEVDELIATRRVEAT